MPNYFAPALHVEVNGGDLAADVTKNIQEVSIVNKKDLIDTFSMVIANAYPRLRWTHTSDADLFMEGNSVKIALGYVDDLQEVMDGEITKISPTFPDNGMPTVSIEGYTRLHWLSGDKKTRTFSKMSEKQIIEKVAREAGLQAQVDDAGSTYEYVIQTNQTDLEFVRERARRIRFEVLAKNTTLIFRKPPEDAAKVYTFVWGHTQEAFSEAPNTLPLKSFSPDLNTMQQVGEVTVRGYDPASKKEIVGHAGPGSEDTKMNNAQSGAKVAFAAFHRDRKFVRVNVPVASQAEADQHARAIYNDRAMTLVSGSGNTIGVPDLKSGNVVNLRGLGPRFSGFYYVWDATHSIGSNGYTTSFTVNRNDVS